MRFQLDHDWQGNMSTPRARIGESAKTQLLLVLCAIWMLLGLLGHEPWKPLESLGISTIKNILDGASLISPLASGEVTLSTPPLYYLIAALAAKALNGFLSIHNAARLSNLIWISIVLLMVGMTSRELWGKGYGRHASFIMIGTVGLIISAHSINNEIASLASMTTGFYAIALSKRRPWRASVLLGAAFSVGFLSNGLTSLLTMIGTACSLPMLFRLWRTRKYLIVISTALAIAMVPISTWLLLFYYESPAIFASWLDVSLNSFKQSNHLYFIRILIWFAWPALPLALWTLWRYRLQLLNKPKFQLSMLFFIVGIILLGSSEAEKDINALPLLIPLVALGAGSVDQLRRGAAAALNWFGITLFGAIGVLIWLGWLAMITGYPAKIKERLTFLSGMDLMPFNWLYLLVAMTVTVIWLMTCVRTKYTNKSAVTNWAVGVTLCWSLLNTLWLPLLDSAKSYAPVFNALHDKLPAHFSCVNSLNVGQSQRLLLHYYTNIKLIAVEDSQQLDCDLYLIQDNRGVGRMQPSQEWSLIWQGKRTADRKEAFRLYKYVAKHDY